MEKTSPDRRCFLGWCTNVVLALVGLLVAIPAFVYLCAPVRRKGGLDEPASGFLDVGPLSDFPENQWSLHVLEVEHRDGWTKGRTRHAVWVRRQGDRPEGVTVLSSICPHLGCPVDWQPDHARFACPCHGGVFDPTGHVVAGPPPRAMDPLPFEVRAGRLHVRWQDFQIGVGKPIPVSTG